MTRYITLGSIGMNLVKTKALNSFSSPHIPRFARADGGRWESFGNTFPKGVILKKITTPLSIADLT